MASDWAVRLSAAELAGRIAAREISPVEVVEGYLERIDRYDDRLHSYITVCREESRAAAREAEAAVLRGDPLGPLHGLPLAVKDQFHTRGIRTTAASTIMKDHVSDYDATVIARCRGAGAILLGKLNMTEFAAGAGDAFKYGAAPNPWNLDRDAGGSSTGSGIAVAASLCAISLGEDTGGSVRYPSSVNGVVGLRPSWGLVSRHGIVGINWSMDTCGPMTRTVEDTALVLGAIAGHDPRDPLTSRRAAPPYAEEIHNGLDGLRMGLLTEYMDPEIGQPEVLGAVRGAVGQLRELGADVEEVSLPILEYAGAVGSILAESNGATLHKDWLLSRPQDYGPNLRRRLTAGHLLPGHVVQKAERMRSLLRRQWMALFERYDVLLSPTTTAVAGPMRRYSEITTREKAEATFSFRGSTTFAAALAGSPALSVPCGFDSDDMPIGLQVMAPPFQESTVLRVGHQYQQVTDWHTRRPPEFP